MNFRIRFFAEILQSEQEYESADVQRSEWKETGLCGRREEVETMVREGCWQREGTDREKVR